MDISKNFSVINLTTGIDTTILSNNYKTYFRNRFLPTRLAKDLTISQLSRLEESKNELTGIIYKQYPERIFNPRIRASHVLGYLKEINHEMISTTSSKNDYQFGDLIGWSGLERQYESLLRGKKGVSYFQVDAFGREAGNVEGHDNSLPQPGQDIYTTLDITLQELLESEFRGKKGAGIVSNPKTGGILSYVSSPDYAPDLFTGLISKNDWKSIITDPDKPLLNRVSNGTYPPGSIYKMVVAFELLEKRFVSTDWEILCTGSYEFYDRTFRCWNEFGHGKVNLEKALAGFEKSGHFFFNKPNGFGYDDGINSAIQVCHLLVNENKKISEILKELPTTYQTPTMAPFCKDEEKYKVVESLVEKVKKLKNDNIKIDGQNIIDILTVNGVRFSLEDGSWGLIRASSNKPSLVVVVESSSSDNGKMKIFEFIDNLLKSTGKVGKYDQII